ncbi:MAG TPA: CocE/NonD family hydrolase, partial [Pseudonocardiaceae bacterium]|nr:CocE/NonD family hydrolase [Pseudonocardiaceae bacterium]
VLGQLRETMILVLLVAAVLTGVTGDFADCAVILLVVAVNTTVGVLQERRAVGAVAALRSLTTPVATVVRGGQARRVTTPELVPGDVLRVAEGDVVGADARLLTAHALQVDEALLTGESQPVDRDPAGVCPASAVPGDRTTMLHGGTLVVHGTGSAVVVATGTHTELGRIATLLHERQAPDTSLQRRLAGLVRRLSLAAVLGCVLVVLLGLLRGQPWELMVITGISLAVAAIPESLPAVVALALAAATRRMAARGAIVRSLSAVEALGITVVSCREVVFDSGGLRCAGDFYWPDTVLEQVPCVVMGHGGSGTKRLGLPGYAEKFVARGMAALVFDYRHFGASEGQPRQVIDIEKQRNDYRAAISYARNYSGVDPQRIALWGTSLSGGHVLAVAAEDPTIAAVVSQVPLIDGWHRGRGLRQRLNWDITLRTLRFIAAAVRDITRQWCHRSPYLVPVIARPGQVAVFTEPEATVAFEALGGEATGWQNALAPRFIFRLPRYKKGTAERLTMPLLMCLANHDLQASSRFAARIASRASAAEVHHYPIGHFDVYVGSLFARISTEQANFLYHHLCETK